MWSACTGRYRASASTLRITPTRSPIGSGTRNRGGGRGGPPVVSPEVNADKSFTVRFRAPDAKDVVVIGEIDGKEHPMTKGEAGIWTATIGPLAPDVTCAKWRRCCSSKASGFQLPASSFSDSRSWIGALEAGSGKLEAGSWKPEAGSWNRPTHKS
jgi:hypothetical protein